MKYLKRFNESDSWAGSLYAYHNPIPPSRGVDQVPIPNQEAHPYKCKDCDMEFYSLDDDIESKKNIEKYDDDSKILDHFSDTDNKNIISVITYLGFVFTSILFLYNSE